MRRLAGAAILATAVCGAALAQPSLEPIDPTRLLYGEDRSLRPILPSERCAHFGLRPGGAAYAECMADFGEVDPLAVLGDHGLDEPIGPTDLLGNQGLFPTDMIPLEGTERAERQWQYR
jgi:hypothetical protein